MDRRSRIREWRHVSALALRDALDEWPVTLCLVFALAAVLTPVLVLFGLRSGIVTTMQARLLADPATREIVLRGHTSLPPAWFARLAARPDVAFVVPRTRRLSATITLARPDGTVLPDVDMVPTAPGDPLLPPGLAAPSALHDILLSHTAALRLRAGPGDRVEGRLVRRRQERTETVAVPLVVAGVLPETAAGTDAAFVTLALLEAAEDYRDGAAVAALGVTEGAPPSPRVAYASARLYAATLEDVAPLAALLRAEGLELVTRAREIDTVRAIDRVLTLVFVVLAGIGVAGYLVSLAASLWAHVDRKRREIALLRLLGVRAWPLVGFPAAQATLIAAGGVALSAGAALAVAAAFNRAFATHLAREEFVCLLRPRDLALAAGLTLAAAWLASAAGGWRAARIDPADHVREP